jgi:hypothetical protein
MIQSIRRFTVTLSDTLYQQPVSITPVIDIDNCFCLVTVRSGQTMQNTANYTVTAYLSSTNQVIVERKGNMGAVVCSVTVLEVTVSSRVHIQRLTNVALSNGTNNIAINGEYPRNKKFVIYQVVTASSVTPTGLAVTAEITTDNNLQVITGVSGLYLYAYVIYIPDCTVHHLTGTIIGNSNNINVSSLNITREKTFSHLGFRGYSLSVDKYKSAFLTSDTSVNIRSYVTSTVNYTLQLVHRINNYVRRVITEVTPASYDVYISGTIDFTKAFAHLVNLFGRLSEANTTSNYVDNFGFTVSPASPDKIVLEKYNLGVASMCSVEVVEMGAIFYPSSITAFRRLNIRGL